MKYGPDNNNWRGGRIIDPRGYVLIRVESDHHLADVRGYAYEHRLIAEKILNRRLKPGEVVHHRNGNNSDNRRRNLEVLPSIKIHRARHRKRSDLRDPGEPNPMISCACGCRTKFKKYDDFNRPRRFVSGHNTRIRHG